jgi:hypothetical protein
MPDDADDVPSQPTAETLDEAEDAALAPEEGHAPKEQTVAEQAEGGPERSVEDLAQAAQQPPAQGPQNPENQLDPEVQSKLEDLREEFGELSELLVDVAFNETVADFLIDAEEVIRHHAEKRGGKARFYIHREGPTEELYLLLSPKPAQFNSAWMQMQNPNPEMAMQAYERYVDDILKTVMVYPKYQNVDWNLDGTGVYQPMGLTKSRLVDTFFSYEMNDPNEPNSVAFSDEEVDDAVNVAQRDKPSL